MDDTATISPADLSDRAQAEAWLALLEHYARDPMGGGEGLSGYARRHLVERLGQRPDFVGLLAWQDRVAVGLANCFVGFSTFAARPLLNVHDLVVHAGHRRRGIGQALLAAAEREARARDCCKLTLEVLSNNHAALSSYRRFGFRPYQLDPSAGDATFLQKWL